VLLQVRFRRAEGVMELSLHRREPDRKALGNGLLAGPCRLYSRLS